MDVDIDFIKWCEPYADGYSFEKNLTGFNISKEGIACGWEFNGKTYGYKILYGDFLQRAIEGVNKSARFDPQKYIIEITYTMVKVYDWNKKEYCLTIMLDFNNEDHAKESALKYIHEQEQKA